MNTVKKFSYWFEVAAVGIVLGLVLQGARAWTEPSTAPPGGNVGAPLNTGSLTQVKQGSLGVNSNGNPVGLSMFGKALADDFCLNSDPNGKCLSKVGPGTVVASGLYGWCEESVNNISSSVACFDLGDNLIPCSPSTVKAPASCASSKKCSCPSGYSLIRTGGMVHSSPDLETVNYVTDRIEIGPVSVSCDVIHYYTCLKN